MEVKIQQQKVTAHHKDIQGISLKAALQSTSVSDSSSLLLVKLLLTRSFCGSILYRYCIRFETVMRKQIKNTLFTLTKLISKQPVEEIKDLAVTKM